MNANRKGKVGERELAGVLRDFGFTGARRGQQRSGLDQSDVVGLPGWHVECKRVETLNVWRAFAQAQRDAPVGTAPLVAMRRNKSPWLVALDLRTFLAILATLASLAPASGSSPPGSDPPPSA